VLHETRAFWERKIKGFRGASHLRELINTTWKKEIEQCVESGNPLLIKGIGDTTQL